MADPAHSRRLFLFAAALLLVGAAFLRFQQIGRRSFHADEAVQAYQTWQLLRGEGYTYDPADKHGPFLYYAAVGLAKISGWSPASLNETRLRSFTLFAGLGTLALILANAARLGRATVLVGSALLAVAPLAIIYDTCFIQEAWFCFFTWALFFAALHWREKPTFPGALLVGALAGLMQATKETSVLHFAALGVALMAVRPRSEWTRLWPGGLAALFAALFVYVIFYSAFFTRWTGVADGILSYFNYTARAAGSAHDQPWHYYWSMLWLHTREGVHWGEPLLLIAALIGAGFAFTRRANPAQRALAVFTLTLLFLYSVIPYKTPWLLLTPYAGLTLLAGYGVRQMADGLPGGFARYAPAAFAFVLVVAGVWRNFPALSRYANDDRNPYVYQPTSADLARLVTAVAAMPADRKIAVVSPDHAWPLPWYWRDRASTGYFATPPANLSSYDLVLFDSRFDSPLPASVTAFGLRPNVVLWCTAR